MTARRATRPGDNLVMGLALADGSTWGITAEGRRASSVVARLSAVMCLRPMTDPEHLLLVREEDDDGQRVRDGCRTGAPPGEAPAAGESTGRPPDPSGLVADARPGSESSVTCLLPPRNGKSALVIHLMWVSQALARQAQSRGGLLIHGALAERGGDGVIFAGPSGAGKTTVSGRLSSPWRSLSDDATLVLRDRTGTYRAHPWPTWSRFGAGRPGESWDVQDAIPLRRIFILVQASEDRTEPVGAGRALCLLVPCTEQVTYLSAREMTAGERRILRERRLDLVSALSRTVPCTLLYFSRGDGFLGEIERVMTGGEP